MNISTQQIPVTLGAKPSKKGRKNNRKNERENQMQDEKQKQKEYNQDMVLVDMNKSFKMSEYGKVHASLNFENENFLNFLYYNLLCFYYGIYGPKLLKSEYEKHEDTLKNLVMISDSIYDMDSIQEIQKHWEYQFVKSTKENKAKFLWILLKSLFDLLNRDVMNNVDLEQSQKKKNLLFMFMTGAITDKKYLHGFVLNSDGTHKFPASEHRLWKDFFYVAHKDIALRRLPITLSDIITFNHCFWSAAEASNVDVSLYHRRTKNIMWYDANLNKNNANGNYYGFDLNRYYDLNCMQLFNANFDIQENSSSI